MKKNRQTRYRTATTTYPCCRQALGDSEGAGRIRLPAAKLYIADKKKAPIGAFNYHDYGLVSSVVSLGSEL
jgi:hypothetical protein